jgi:hypothetical protein
MICPADLCDIFECPDLADSRLKVSVYKDRKDKIFENKPNMSKKKTNLKYNQVGEDGPAPLRYQLM